MQGEGRQTKTDECRRIIHDVTQTADNGDMKYPYAYGMISTACMLHASSNFRFTTSELVEALTLGIEAKKAGAKFEGSKEPNVYQDFIDHLRLTNDDTVKTIIDHDTYIQALNPILRELDRIDAEGDC